MSGSWSLLLLFLAALLEAGGDALARAGLRSAAGPGRIFFLLASALVLFLYGCAVNAPDWDFGKLLGVYVVFFFVVAQLIGWLGFRQVPSAGTLLGGVFILLGGIIVYTRG